MRENHKFLAVRTMALIKPCFLEAGELFHCKGRLDDPSQIWFLRLDELIEAIENDEWEIQETVNERINRFKEYKKLNPPRVITSDGEIFRGGLKGKNLPQEAIPGIGVSSGIYEGIAKVVTDPTEEAVKPGEILVAKFTDPGWTALFVHASALISEVGGMMTHGALVAREYGIPAVVGIENATRDIQSGDRVYVDGTSGYVLIKEKKQ